MPKKDASVTVCMNGRENVIKLSSGTNYEQLLLELNLNPEEVLVFVDNEPVPFDEQVRPGTVKVIKVVSGG
ncbi:MAG TPA: MoaD/ThiS family protein [Candidatus Bathyarchaeia archaeon]|nr:MoaD/ThiS family protein [Candidatus Bathyarchaeia archaeon]